MNILEEAQLIYMAQPTAYNARALQIALKLERFTWKPIHTAPIGYPILATWVTDDGRVVSGQVWTQVSFPTVDSELESQMGMPVPVVHFSFDHDGEDLLIYTPTHWMELPEGPK